MKQYDYAALKERMNGLRQIAVDRPDQLAGAVETFLAGQEQLPPECSDIIFWILTYDLDPSGAVRCFDWYMLSDVYQKLAVDHDDVPVLILNYLKRHPAVESEELADYLWFAALYRLAVQNAWQLAYVDRLELFRAFVGNMTVYAAHTVQAEAWNDEDIYLLSPGLRLTYHVGRAYEYLDQENLGDYIACLDLAAEDCPDLQSCLEALKELPKQTPPLSDMMPEEIQRHAVRLTGEIKRTFQGEDWLRTAELVKEFDRDGFDPGLDFELLSIRCQLAERGLLW